MPTPKEQELSALVAILAANGTLRARSLNVKSPDAPVSSQNNWTKIHAQLISDSAANDFTKLMKDLLLAGSYNSAVQVFRSLVAPLASATGKTARIIACLPDGTVYFDSKNKDNIPTDTTSNFFTNAGNKDINENHNTRACIMNAQLVADGVSFESKYSSSTGKYEDYVAMRIGPQGANFGTVRYSVY